MTQVHSLAALESFIAAFVTTLSVRTDGATIIALSGDLGAGKTTFAKVLAKQLGADEEVTSPTFVIERIYQLPGYVGHRMSYISWKRLIHIDAYRLEGAHQLESLGWKEISADPSNLILIEWPEMVEGAIPEGAIRVKIEWISETERDITILQEARVQ